MGAVFIVGVPVDTRKRFIADAVRGSLRVETVPAALGDEGYFRLKPTPEAALHALNAYMDELADYKDATVLVLPYTPLPDDLKTELKCLKDEIGADVTFIKAGEDGWPKATVGGFGDSFHEAVYAALVRRYFPEGKPKLLSPSECFEALAKRCSNIIIPGSSIALCDKVAPHRHKFMRTAVEAFEELATDGLDGLTIEDFFSSYKLKHAQSGGIVAGIQLFKTGQEQPVFSSYTHTHLKEGDGTTPVAAARIYYHHFDYEKTIYLAILYAGPHPDTNVTRQHSVG